MNLSKFKLRIPEDGELCVYIKPGSKFHGHVYKCKYEEGYNSLDYIVRNYTLIPVISSLTKVHKYQSGTSSSPNYDTWPEEMLIVNNLAEANYIIIIINELQRIADVHRMYHHKHVASLVRNKRLAEKQLDLFC